MFHVPDAKRWRIGPLGSDESYGNNGAFMLDGPIAGRMLWCIASDGDGWEHVSVHAEQQNGKSFIPTWLEMCWIKALFWDPEDVVMQLHPAESAYVNTHRNTLHLWRPIAVTIPTPPPELVGIPGVRIPHE